MLLSYETLLQLLFIFFFYSQLTLENLFLELFWYILNEMLLEARLERH